MSVTTSNVIVPADGSPASAVVLHWCCQHLTPTDHVIGVYPLPQLTDFGMTPFTGIPSEWFFDPRELAAWAKPLQDAFIPYDVVPLADRLPLGLCRAAEESVADLIVVAKNAGGIFRHLVAPDLAGCLVHNLPCPVLVLPAAPVGRRRPRMSRAPHARGRGRSARQAFHT